MSKAKLPYLASPCSNHPSPVRPRSSCITEQKYQQFAWSRTTLFQSGTKKGMLTHWPELVCDNLLDDDPQKATKLAHHG
jgi:hypothetical protein